jgi:hypothetical protein
MRLSLICYLSSVATTNIGGRDILVRDGPRSTIYFSGGRAGPHEAGDYEFWTAEGPKGKTWARSRKGTDAGERFRRMEHRPNEESGFEIARAANQIRPATCSEIERWINSESKKLDAPHAKSGHVDDSPVVIVQDGGTYKVVRGAPSTG